MDIKKFQSHRVSAVKPVADAEFVANTGKRNGNTGKFFFLIFAMFT